MTKYPYTASKELAVLFGVWPGVVAADLVELTPLETPPEDVERTRAALDRLQGGAAQFYVRCYRHFRGTGAPEPGVDAAPADPGQYAGAGRLIDLVACYRATSPDPAGYAGFIRQAVETSPRGEAGRCRWARSSMCRLRWTAASPAASRRSPRAWQPASGNATASERTHETGEVSVYELFSLRDGISDGNWQNGFGLLHDDYAPKPAYETIRRIIEAS